MGIERLKKYYSDNKLIINCTIVAILFFVNCFVKDFSYMAFSIVAIFILFSNISNGFSILVFSIPYCCLDDYNSIYLFFGCLLLFLIRSYIVLLFIDKKKLPIPFIISVVIFVIYALLPFSAYNGGMFIKLGIIILLVLFFNLLLMYGEELNIKFNLSVLAISMMMSACFYLTYFISPYMKAKDIWYNGEYFIRFTCLLINPNTLAMMSEICLAFLTYYILIGKFTWIDAISYIIFAVLGCSSLSKTFLILFLIMLFILFIYLCSKFNKQIFWTIIAICVGIILIAIFANDYLFTYLGRFMFVDPENLTFEEIINVVTTYRYGLWKGVIEYLFMNPYVLIFGRGLGAPLIETLSAHNFYISLVYEVGLIGTVLFVAMFLVTYICHKRRTNIKFHWAILIPMIMVGMLMMVEDLFLYIY